MDYGQIYTDLIQRGLTRTLGDDVYLERHHVWPKCIGGPDEESNLVKLTPEEHFLAHQLLVKMFPENSKLIYAVHLMCSHSNKKRINNKMFGWIRKKVSESRKNKSFTEEHKLKLKEARKKQLCSEETRLKMSKSRKGRKFSDEHRRKISESAKGRKMSQEAIDKRLATIKANKLQNLTS